MKRMTISLLVTAVILVMGAFVLWLFVSAPRSEPATPSKPVPAEPVTPPESDFNGALNLYLTAPARMPAEAARAELALVKAVIVRPNGEEVAFFEGSRRVTLQEGLTQKVLSDRIPNGRWNRLKLTFSPAADLAYADGRPVAPALLDRREAVISFDADVPASRTLALFVPLPLEAESSSADGLATLNLSPEPRPAASYVFGAFLLDPRSRGSIWRLASPTLHLILKEEFGFDIELQQQGSSGFVPANGAPSPSTP